MFPCCAEGDEGEEMFSREMFVWSFKVNRYCFHHSVASSTTNPITHDTSSTTNHITRYVISYQSHRTIHHQLSIVVSLLRQRENVYWRSVCNSNCENKSTLSNLFFYPQEISWKRHTSIRRAALLWVIFPAKCDKNCSVRFSLWNGGKTL